MSTARQRAGLRGVTKLRRTLRRLEPDMREGIKRELTKGAQAIEADMMMNIPKDTGDTAAHISYKIARDGLTARIGFVGKKAVEGGYRARFIEFGTKGHGNVPAQPARPFMAPAFDANKTWMLKNIRWEIGAALRKAAQGDGTI